VFCPASMILSIPRAYLFEAFLEARPRESFVEVLDEKLLVELDLLALPALLLDAVDGGIGHGEGLIEGPSELPLTLLADCVQLAVALGCAAVSQLSSRHPLARPPSWSPGSCWSCFCSKLAIFSGWPS